MSRSVWGMLLQNKVPITMNSNVTELVCMNAQLLFCLAACWVYYFLHA